MKRLLAVAFAATTVVSVGEVRAAATHTVRATVDAAYVGVGEVIRYSIVLRTQGALEVDSSSPGKTDGFDLVGTASMPGESTIFHNGVVEQFSTFTVTYRLKAKKPGKYKLGPGKFVIRGKALTTNAIDVEVADSAALPRDPLEELLNPAPPPPPPKAEPLDPLAKIDELPTDPNERDFFVRVVPDERKPIVGAQVTLKVFVYSRRPPEVMLKRPPVATDFRLVSLGGVDKVWHPMTIAGQEWSYAALEAFAVFPLRKGKLPIGPSMVGVQFQDFFGKTSERDFDSIATEIEAFEPPVEGRPAGYVLGDVVSDLVVKADVTPRKIVDGHAVVTLRMAGGGRLDPLRPILPTPAGVNWTTTNDETHTTHPSLALLGERKLQLDARFDKSGQFDLGDAVLHVWDPARKGYQSVHAALGTVLVERAADKADESAAALPPLPSPRGVVGPKGEGATIADRPWTWGLCAGAPLVVVLGQLGLGAAKKRKKKQDERADDPREQARAALSEARAAKSTKDATASCARALDRALEAATGVRARGLTRTELGNALAETSLPAALRRELVETFEALENARFAGVDPPSIAAITALVEQLSRGGT